MRGHCHERSLWQQVTATRSHCDKKSLLWVVAVTRGHCDKRSLSWAVTVTGRGVVDILFESWIVWGGGRGFIWKLQSLVLILETKEHNLIIHKDATILGTGVSGGGAETKTYKLLPLVTTVVASQQIQRPYCHPDVFLSNVSYNPKLKLRLLFLHHF